MYLYRIKIIYINIFYDARYWNSEKNNRQMIFLISLLQWIADTERSFFLSYDTGVSHQVHETKQLRSLSGVANCISGVSIDIRGILPGMISLNGPLSVF